MGLSRAKQIQHAKAIGVAYANDLFKAFLDHKNRGPCYNWKEFPDMIYRWAYTQSFMCFPHRIKKDIQEVAAITGKTEAIRLMKEHGPNLV